MSESPPTPVVGPAEVRISEPNGSSAVDFVELLQRREAWARNGFDDSFDRAARYGLLDGDGRKRRG